MPTATAANVTQMGRPKKLTKKLMMEKWTFDAASFFTKIAAEANIKPATKDKIIPKAVCTDELLSIRLILSIETVSL